MHIGYRWASQKDRDHWEDQDVGGSTILKEAVFRTTVTSQHEIDHVAYLQLVDARPSAM
jgi:hypothetical protein